ncbi:HEXXH motif domain-containing protein [Parafrankia sp. EUN1f]|uniref:HEXXH motif domain-containing protein n=1 Tax=Parafrankia sp. EUN1f TaxID=102897 RepID=UPI0001C44AE9|nr:HEXXH motif domain-containing protein [Parafrankia sp. EUN1f]EFC83329.1 hypothetical protein FrEUN1fDRAFT_3508 [Parafrankia sp. EUN1f]
MPEGLAGTGLREESHRLSARDIDALSLGALEIDVIDRLVEAEVSFRRLAFRAVLDATRQRPEAVGPLCPADEAWSLLVEVERGDPAAVDAVLDRPLAGAWAGRLLRRLRGRLNDDIPLWVEVGYLHSMAAAAAVRAGVVAAITVPTRLGVAHLPTLGHVRLPQDKPWGSITVRSEPDAAWLIASAGRIGVHGHRAGGGPLSGRALEQAAGPDDAAEPARDTVWRPTRTASGVRVTLEDVDPYRRAGQATRPVPLPEADLLRWEERLAEVWQMLRTGHPRLAAGVGAVVSTVVPVAASRRFRPFSASSSDAFGSIELSEPDDPVYAAAALAHEVRHVLLGALMHLADLVDTSVPGGLRYVPWRTDPRPPEGVLQGIYALFGVTDFWRTRRRAAAGTDAMLAQFEFALWRGAVLGTATDFARTGPLTPLGRRFLSGVVTSVQGWVTEPVPPEPLRLAELMLADTQALWRAHHVEPEAGAVRRLAEAWAAGVPASADALGPTGPSGPTGLAGAPAVRTRLVPDPTARAFDTRACLGRLWLSAPAAFLQAGERDAADPDYRGASPADYALVRGDRSQARRLYMEQLARSNADRRALVGLGLTLDADDPAGRVLRERPELVHAMTEAVSRLGGMAEPAELAAWLLPVAGTAGDGEEAAAPAAPVTPA